MDSVFLITKPLQYFNASNIEDNNSKICLFVGSFSNAKGIYDRVFTISKLWDKTHYFEQIMDAYRWIIKNSKSIINLYIDSDYGFRKYFYLQKLSNVNIYVYEEGMGAYRNNLRNSKLHNNIIRFLYKLMGHESYLGGSKYTKGIYLYDIEKHRRSIPNYKKELRHFKETFFKHLETFEDKRLFSDKRTIPILHAVKNRKVIIYLTSWVYDYQVDEILQQYPDYVKILKPHPHLIHGFKEMQKKFDYIIEGGEMIEFFISEVVKESEELIVLHQNSSALLYLKEVENLKSLII